MIFEVPVTRPAQIGVAGNGVAKKAFQLNCTELKRF